MIEKLSKEFIASMLEVMNVQSSPFVTEALLTKLGTLHPKYYNEIMISLMDNQNQFMKPIEKISSAIQKTVDRYCEPESIEALMAYIKRQYRGMVVSDHVDGVFKKGVKIAVSLNGDHLVNLYNGQNLSDGDTIEVYDWALNNFEKIGLTGGYSYDHTKEIPILSEPEEVLKLEASNRVDDMVGSLASSVKVSQ